MPSAQPFLVKVVAPTTAGGNLIPCKDRVRRCRALLFHLCQRIHGEAGCGELPVYARDADWLKRTLLLFPHVARMSPQKYTYHDEPVVGEFRRTFVDGAPLLHNVDLGVIARGYLLVFAVAQVRPNGEVRSWAPSAAGWPSRTRPLEMTPPRSPR